MQLNVSPEINALCEKALAMSVRQARAYVGVGDLFAAVLDSPEHLPPRVREHWLNPLFTVMREVHRSTWAGSLPASAVGEPFYTPRAIAALQQAGRLAERQGVPAGSAHLLMALLSDELSAPARAMDGLDLGRHACLADLKHAQGDAVFAGARQEPAAAQAQAGGAPLAAAPREEPGPAASERGRLVRDLTAAAGEGSLRRAVGRDQEIFQVLQALARKTKNSVMLVGDAGVGKTQVVEGLALELAEGEHARMPRYRILELNVAALLSGTQYRGAFEEKVMALLDELKASEDAVLFIDEAHLIMGAGATDGDAVDLANLLKPVLARGEIRCIAATTLSEYRKFVEKDPAIERRFQMVRVEELSEPDTRRVLERLQCALEQHHGVHISRRALQAAIDLTVRYMPNLNLPDKAIDVLDQACARHRLTRLAASSGAEDVTMPPIDKHRVTPHDVRKVVSQVTAIPIEEMTAEERMRLNDLDRRLKKRIIGQDEAVTRTVSAVKKARAGLADPDRPDAVLLFLGPTGVGKTQLAKVLAEHLFGSENHLQRFDMTEYAESHDVSRLLGAAPGYVGSEEEGQLAAAVRRMPFSILLFDEIEKAHPRVFDIFLPVFDEGKIKTSQGRTASFKNCIIIMTSNVGAELLAQGPGENERELMARLRQHFRPEFINRIDAVIPFYPLLAEDIRSILHLEIERLRNRLRERKVGVRMYQHAYEYLAEEGYSPEYGARELRRVFEKRVVEPIGELLLEHDFAPGDMVDVRMEGGQLQISKGRPHSAVDRAVS